MAAEISVSVGLGGAQVADARSEAIHLFVEESVSDHAQSPEPYKIGAGADHDA
jgi:hypothetical protein